MNEQDDKVRARAYMIWEQEGRPEGKHEHHWYRAAKEAEEISDQHNQNAEVNPPTPPSGISNNLHPGGTLPAGTNSGVGSLGTGGGSTSGNPTGSRSSSH